MGDIYDSVVVGFLAVLGIDAAREGFQEATTYTPHLSALIKDAAVGDATEEDAAVGDAPEEDAAGGDGPAEEEAVGETVEDESADDVTEQSEGWSEEEGQEERKGCNETENFDGWEGDCFEWRWREAEHAGCDEMAEDWVVMYQMGKGNEERVKGEKGEKGDKQGGDGRIETGNGNGIQ